VAQTFQYCGRLIGAQVKDADGPVVGAAEKRDAIRRETHVVDPVRVTCILFMRIFKKKKKKTCEMSRTLQKWISCE
jgi:hypothetical protein